MGRKQKVESIVEELDRLPPVMCRIVAHRVVSRCIVEPLKIEEIAARAGLGRMRTSWIARQPTWARIPVEEADAFRSACGVARSYPKVKLMWRFIRRQRRQRQPFGYLRKLRRRDYRKLQEYLSGLTARKAGK